MLCKFLNSEGVSIPLQDTSENKNLVLSKLENELKETLARCQELTEQGNLKKQIYKDGIEEARRIAKTFQAYKESLSIDIGNLEGMLNDLRLSAVKLTQQMANRK